MKKHKRATVTVDLIDKQRGAVEACWAHNSEVGRSKLLAAIYNSFFLSQSFGAVVLAEKDSVD